MGLLLPSAAFTKFESNVATPASPFGTAVSTSASAHTKSGTYTQLIASTAFSAYWVEIVMSDVAANGVDTGTLVDIAIGGVGSETVIIANLNAGHAQASTNENGGGQKYVFPLYIPIGSRISADAQSVAGTTTANVSIRLWGGPTRSVWAGHTVTTYGANTGTSQGIVVTPGASGAEGSFTEITSSTSMTHRFLSVGVAGDDNSTGNITYALDVGIGPATETVIAGDFYYGSNTSEQLSYSMPMGFWSDVPAGSRLTARASASGSASTSDVILYGVS